MLLTCYFTPDGFMIYSAPMNKHQNQRDTPAPPENLISFESLRQAWDMPWKAQLELWRLALIPLNQLSLWFSGVTIQQGWRFYGRPIWEIHRRSHMSIGKCVNLCLIVAGNPARIIREVE